MPDHADIPPSVAEHLDQIFADEPFAGPCEIGRLLRVGPKTLRRLGDEGRIKWRPKGRVHRQYTREDIEDYLRRRDPMPTHAPMAEPKPPRAPRRHRNAEPFTAAAARAAKRKAQKSRSHIKARAKSLEAMTSQSAAQWLYFVQCGAYVKIGITHSVSDRLNGLQIANPQEITLIGVMPGDRALESRIHKKFATLRRRGEWFRLTPELKQFIEANCDD